MIGGPLSAKAIARGQPSIQTIINPRYAMIMAAVGGLAS
jgi:hypothetical protein